MSEPPYPQAKSEHISKDFRLEEVQKFKAESKKVSTILAEIAAKKAELVNKTPFDDSCEDSLALQPINRRLEEIYSIIQKNSDTTRAYVLEAIEPVESTLETLHQKVNKLLPKDKKNREVLPLRDPIDLNLFPIFLTNAGNQATRRKDLKQSQLRIAYTLLRTSCE